MEKTKPTATKIDEKRFSVAVTESTEYDADQVKIDIVSRQAEIRVLLDEIDRLTDLLAAGRDAGLTIEAPDVSISEEAQSKV